MIQLDLFLDGPTIAGKIGPPPSRWPCNDPELWDAIAQSQAAAMRLLRRRHPSGAEAMAQDLEQMRGPNPYIGRRCDMVPGARYGSALVLAYRIRNGKGATS